MSDQQQPRSMRDVILASIKDGGVSMRPRWHFILKATLVATCVIILFLTLLYTFSFIVFFLKQTGILFIPAFGSHGIYVFLGAIPWLLVVLCVGVLVLLEILVYRYAFSYRRPLFYSVLGVIFVVTVGGVFVESAHIHSGLSRFATDHQLPLAAPLYRGVNERSDDSIHSGVVVRTLPTGFHLQRRQGDIIKVVITPQTRLPYGADFSDGDVVVVFGDRHGDMVSAFGIREIERSSFMNNSN